LPKFNKNQPAVDTSGYLHPLDFSTVQLMARTGQLVKTIEVQKLEKLHSNKPTSRINDVQNIMVESRIVGRGGK